VRVSQQQLEDLIGGAVSTALAEMPPKPPVVKRARARLDPAAVTDLLKSAEGARRVLGRVERLETLCKCVAAPTAREKAAWKARLAELDAGSA
jgi:hypothetical protein